MRPGDALNKPHSHVMLFLRFTPDRKAEVMEASPGACNGRVCRNVYPLSSLLARGYTPVRFRALANDSRWWRRRRRKAKPNGKTARPVTARRCRRPSSTLALHHTVLSCVAFHERSETNMYTAGALLLADP